MLEMIDFVIRAGAPEPIGYKGENLAKTLEIITDSGPGWSYRLEARMGGVLQGGGEQGWWNWDLYESKSDNNVWTPDAYPGYWKEV